MAKLKEAEHKRVLRDQEKELRRAEKQAEKRKRESAIQAKKAEGALLRERVERQRSERSLGVVQRQVVRGLQDEVRRRDRERRDEAGRQALQRHKAALEAQKTQQKSLTDGRIVAFDGVLPSFLDEEYQYMKQASADFPEEITSDIQMRCMKDYQRAISDASRRLPCGICGGLFQEDEVVSIGLQAGDLRYFLQRTKTAPDCCAVKDDMVSLCTTCNSAIAKRAISPLSAGNFVNCLFCQDYPEALKNLNTVEEAFIARAHVIGIFLKLTSGAKGGIGYRGSRGHSEAVRQDPNELLKTYSRRRKHVANEREQGVSHATDPNASKVLGKVQEKVPNGVEDALPDRIHPTPADDNVGKGVSHATGKSIVPQKLQEKLPEKVERAVPNAIHDTSDPVRDIKKWIVL